MHSGQSVPTERGEVWNGWHSGREMSIIPSKYRSVYYSGVRPLTSMNLMLHGA